MDFDVLHKMIRLYLLLLSMLGAVSSQASGLELRTALMPLYIRHADVDEGANPVHATPRLVSFVSRGSQPETVLSLLSSPFVPHHDSTWVTPVDANLISLCRISLKHSYKDLADGGSLLVVTLDLSKFEKPVEVEIKRVQIVELVKKAVEANFPAAQIIATTGEQVGAGNPLPAQ